jgi:hypothetical protein
MLVEVLAGADEASAKPVGNYYFARSPDIGDDITIEGKHIKVKRAWHCPSEYYAGPKFAILVEDWDKSSAPA